MSNMSVQLYPHLRDDGVGLLLVDTGGVAEAGVGDGQAPGLGGPRHQLLPALVSPGDDLLGKLLVLRLAIEGKLIGWFAIWHLIDFEPLDRRL